MSMFHQEYNVIVIGGGPAGVHAARRAAACKHVLLLTTSWDTVAWPARGPIVSIGDTLLDHLSVPTTSGLDPQGVPGMSAAIQTMRKYAMGRTEISGRELLNIDCLKYQEHWKHRLEGVKRLTVFQDTVERITAAQDGWRVETRWGAEFGARRIIVAVGTFVGGRVTIGDYESAAGRPGELGADGLEESLRTLGVELAAVSETVPPTLSAASVDWGRVERGARPGLLGGIRLADGRTMILAPMNGAGKELYPYVIEDDNGETLENRRRTGAPDSDLRATPGLKQVEAIAPGYSVTYLRLVAGQLDRQGEHRRRAGLFFAGRVAGAPDYARSINGGLMAGGAKR